MANIDQILKNRLKKIEIYQKKYDINPYDNFKISKYTTSILHKSFDGVDKEKLIKKEEKFSINGRIESIRNIGKIIFMDIKDFEGKIQFIFNKKNLSEPSWELAKLLDTNDIVYGNGKIAKTRSNELSILIDNFKIVSKSLYPLPSAYFKLKDIEIKYRQRYLDLLINKDSFDSIKKRIKIFRIIRSFLNTKKFDEVETPVLQNIYGGAFAKPFTTYHNSLKQNFYLRIAPEIYLKKLLVGGFEKIYEIGKVFRNEGLSSKHNPEFTELELYWAYANLNDVKTLTISMFQEIAYKLNKTLFLDYNGTKIDLNTENWKEYTLQEIIKNKLDIDFLSIIDVKEAIKLAEKYKINIKKYQENIGKIMMLFFEKYIEKTLIQPTFITGYPLSISPFAKKCKDNSGFVERFELFIGGNEYANAFNELNDPADQKDRLKYQNKLKIEGDEENLVYDESFVTALMYGMPPASGIGIGLDRLVMLFTNNSQIKDVIIFPTLKNEVKD